MVVESHPHLGRGAVPVEVAPGHNDLTVLVNVANAEFESVEVRVGGEPVVHQPVLGTEFDLYRCVSSVVLERVGSVKYTYLLVKLHSGKVLFQSVHRVQKLGLAVSDDMLIQQVRDLGPECPVVPHKLIQPLCPEFGKLGQTLPLVAQRHGKGTRGVDVAGAEGSRSIEVAHKSVGNLESRELFGSREPHLEAELDELFEELICRGQCLGVNVLGPVKAQGICSWLHGAGWWGGRGALRTKEPTVDKLRRKRHGRKGEVE